MGLIANSGELPLIDLIQVKGSSRSTCRILVNGQLGPGALFLQGGDAVYASYAELEGEHAAYAILGEEWVGYRVTSEVTVPPPNMRIGHRRLVMEAVRRLDEKKRLGPVSPVPKAGVGDARAASRASAAAAASAAPPSPSPPDLASASRFVRTPVLLLAAVGVVTLVGGALLIFKGDAQATTDAKPLKTTVAETQEAPPPAPVGPAAASVVEADSLSRPGDSLPILSIGTPPQSPDPAAGLRPTIVCRLLIDSSGNVVHAAIYQHRTNLDTFEEAAVAAVKQYRFQPARKDGSPVAVWINWPIDFI